MVAEPQTAFVATSPAAHMLREANQSGTGRAPRQKIPHVRHSTALKTTGFSALVWPGPPDHVRVKLAKGPAPSPPFKEMASNEISTTFQRGQVRIRERSNHHLSQIFVIRSYSS